MKQENRLYIAILLSIMCCFLTAGIIIQIKTVSDSSTLVGKTQKENVLRDSVLRWKEKYENAYEKLEKKEKELENLRAQASNSSDSSSGLSNKLQRYNMLLGQTDVIGPGVIITLKDGDPKISADPIIHDGDLIEVVNALKNAGADAISINNQRITNRTEITCAGNIITINGEKVGSPFIIKAIGSPLRLNTSLSISGGYLELLKKEHIPVDVKQIDKNTIEIPKYEGIYKFEYARNAE